MPDIHLIASSWGVKVAQSLSGEEGWDRNNVILGIGLGRGSKRSHKVLHRELTPDEQKIQRGYLKLSRGLQKALAMKYVLSVLVRHPDGHYWTNREMAKILSLSIDAFKQRVKRARDEIGRGEFSR